MLLRAKGKAVHVDASIGGTAVVLEGLDNVEVGTLTLREAVLAVKLELGRDDGVLTPAVHVEGGLSEHEGAGIRNTGAKGGGGGEGGEVGGGVLPLGRDLDVRGTSHLEEARGVDELVAAGTAGLGRAAEGVDGVGEGIKSIRVVEGLGAEGAEEDRAGIEGRAVVNVGIGLDNPDKLLHGVVEVKLDLVGGGADRLVARELELLNEVLVGVLGHLAALIRVEEDVVDVEGGGNKGLLVGRGHGLGASGASLKGVHGPEALTDGAEVDVDLHLVVLESNEGKGKTGVAVEPELKGDVECGLRESLAGGAHLSGATGGSAGTRDLGEGGVRDVGKAGGVTNHLEVTTLLLGGERKLVPDVEPITILAVNALTTDLNLNLGDDLLTDEVQPTGIDARGGGGSHVLVDLRKGELEVRAVGKIAVAADRAGHAAAEVSLAGEGLLDALRGEVRVAAVRHLPEGDLRGSRKENVLGAIGDKLHKSSSHFMVIYFRKKIIPGKLLN